eukprot:15484307-Alexandrium_andersonii.AAC.1
MDAQIAIYRLRHAGNPSAHQLAWLSSCYYCLQCGANSKRGIAEFSANCRLAPSSEGSRSLAAFRAGRIPSGKVRLEPGQLSLAQAFRRA